MHGHHIRCKNQNQGLSKNEAILFFMARANTSTIASTQCDFKLSYFDSHLFPPNPSIFGQTVMSLPLGFRHGVVDDVGMGSFLMVDMPVSSPSSVLFNPRFWFCHFEINNYLLDIRPRGHGVLSTLPIG